MTETQATELTNALESMLSRIEQRESVTDQLMEISRIQGQIAPTAPPQLSHFLERRSYTKALEYLQNGVVLDDPNRPECDEGEHP